MCLIQREQSWCKDRLSPAAVCQRRWAVSATSGPYDTSHNSSLGWLITFGPRVVHITLKAKVPKVAYVFGHIIVGGNKKVKEKKKKGSPSSRQSVRALLWVLYRLHQPVGSFSSALLSSVQLLPNIPHWDTHRLFLQGDSDSSSSGSASTVLFPFFPHFLSAVSCLFKNVKVLFGFLLLECQ